ncbi:MAG: Gfo/Idh/MocA family oxidoreductase [Akkermansiaceae bacterium]|nr:Gfo/Idh/MocA family oxidoreductase [Akkermansiaceae bacterium]NNM29624.1 Gfo/Idh/MocA family oxidoreductase [Akkermansiaceae bacterium]
MTAFTRRKFLHTSGLTAGSILGFPAIVSGQNLNGRPRVACIGVGGKGKSDTENTAKVGCDIVGLCDVDGGTLEKMAGKFPKAKKYSDFRKMLEEMDGEIDAVTVSTPDHCHGVAGIKAMQMGKHVYVQKPLTQTVWESRTMRNLARDKNLATQMGNQGSAEDGLRRSVEVIQGGVIGKPLELHVWTNRPVWPQGLDRPEGSDPIPDNLDWELWLGPAQFRPFKKGVYHTFKWRGWKDFGTGALGDMACHTVNMPFRALKLGYPERIECEFSSRNYPETYPLSSRVRFDFPARAGLPPLKFWWYEGNPSNNFKPIRPYPDLIKHVIASQGKFPKSGCLIIGDEGELYSGDDYGRDFFLKQKGDKMYIRGNDHPACKGIPQSIRRAPKGMGQLGHHQEWVDMMKGGAPAYSNFEIAAYLNEVILLGCIAQNIGEGKPIGWDGPAMKSTDNEAASKLVKRNYRDGWEPQV